MESILMFILMVIIIAIVIINKNEADKEGRNINWVAVFFTAIPFILFFGFFISVSLHGTSDSFRQFP